MSSLNAVLLSNSISKFVILDISQLLMCPKVAIAAILSEIHKDTADAILLFVRIVLVVVGFLELGLLDGLNEIVGILVGCRLGFIEGIDVGFVVGEGVGLTLLHEGGANDPDE